jgi:hypothetical protein
MDHHCSLKGMQLAVLGACFEIVANPASGLGISTYSFVLHWLSQRAIRGTFSFGDAYGFKAVKF